MNQIEQTNDLTRSQAAALFESGWWKGLDAKRIVEFQLFTPRLCMPFSDFTKAVEEALGRPVWTTEFGPGADNLKAEFLGHRPTPSFADIMALIPNDKRVLVFLKKEMPDAG